MANESATITEIERIVRANQDTSLTEDHTLEFDGKEEVFQFRVEPTAYGRKLGEIIQPPRPAKLQVSTLTGLVDAVAAGVAGDTGAVKASRIFHVEDHHTVAVESIECDRYGVRDKLILAKYTPPGTFSFDEYMPSEKFLIALETSFLMLDGDDTLYVKKLVSNLKAGDTVHAQDNGVNQTVTVKMGQVEATEHLVKARVKLTPLRTFAECSPVENEFVIRFKAVSGGLPLVALFNLNGLRWQGECMQSIKSYLVKNLPEGSLVVA